MALVRQHSHRYAAVDSYSPSPSSSGASKNLAAAAENPCRALARARSGDPELGKERNNFGSMVKKFMEKRSNLKPGSAGRTALAVPAVFVDGESKRGKKGSNFANLSKKLFQKSGGATDRSGSGTALTEVKTNTRTLGMVLRSERELLNQNKEYEEVISELRLLLEEKNREAEKLKDLCLKQREEIKALKDAILFPDVMNSQLQELLEKQGSELRQANHVIPRLQKQVTSLTGQLRCLAEDLAEVKADKYTTKLYSDEDPSSPKTPMFSEDPADSLKYSSSGPKMSEVGSPDEMFLKDFNPCLTPCFSKTKSQECDEMLSCDKDIRNKSITNFSPDMLSGSRSGNLWRSSEQRQRPCLGNSSRRICSSDENKWSTEKPKYNNIF